VTDNGDWPILTHYDGDHLARIALPIGGIGTGTVSLGGRGDLRDWEVVNRPAKGFAPRHTFLALRVRTAGGIATTRLLEGPLDLSLYEGNMGSAAPNHGLPRFPEASFAAAYPFGQVFLSDPEIPLAVRLQAFNPLIPGAADDSGIPVAVLRVLLTNEGTTPVEASVCASLQNFIGRDGTTERLATRINAFRQEEGLAGLFLRATELDPSSDTWGTLALVTGAADGISFRTAWAELSWGDSLLDFWDDFSEDGRLEEREAGSAFPVASLAVPRVIPPGESRAVTLLLAWHFPNRMSWTPPKPGEECCGGESGRVGNHYATRFADAWDVARQVAAELPRLEEGTVRFVRAFCESDLPAVVKEAALNTLTALRSQTSFRTEDGRFYGWEGCGDRGGCCEGSCTHVWNYEQATAFLFADLARSMREVEYLHATRDDGHMSFRVQLPLSRATEFAIAAADGQMGCLMKLYRDWQLSGDDDWLRRLWPRARSSLAFCWIPGGWDADRDGVMEGCQHNTMDVEYYGPNPQMGGWYLGALRAAEEMARHLGEAEFAATCRALFERGSRWIDTYLFNGEYYEHEIRSPGDATAIAPGLRHASMGARDLADPELQLGAGCLVDQLVGQFLAHVCGLGALLSPENVRTTLASILRYNFRENLHGHFNHMRSYALGDEAALLMATYPKGRRPRRPFPYFNEVMTGFEYTAAVHMLYEGQTEAGLRVMEAIRARYDGRKRSPFDEAECGHHYARAMASWAAVLAWTGFRYSAVEGLLQFAAADRSVTWFWSNGSAWGTFRQEPVDGGADVMLTVLHGALALRRLVLASVGAAAGEARLAAGQSLRLRLRSGAELSFDMAANEECSDDERAV
jgi:uncharacterized protein (DUF608 family)